MSLPPRDPMRPMLVAIGVTGPLRYDVGSSLQTSWNLMLESLEATTRHPSARVRLAYHGVPSRADGLPELSPGVELLGPPGNPIAQRARSSPY
ncbi:hypothetical protein KCU98_g19356, partial [Aureobasidium melanogenum]